MYRIFLLAFFLLSYVATFANALPSYSVTSLGMFTHVFDINDVGQAAGLDSSSPVSGDAFAFLYDPIEGIQNLNILADNASQSAHSAYGINNSGQLVGNLSLADGWISHAFLYDSQSGIEDLGTLGGEYSYAYDINDNGLVVGNSKTINNEPRAFLYDPTTGMQDLGTLGGNQSHATAINNHGQVVGNSIILGSSEVHAFLYDPTTGMQDLGTLGGWYTTANDINDRGQIAGTSRTSDNNERAFLYDPITGMQELGTLGSLQSNALGMNENGQVVGNSHTENHESHAFLYDAALGMLDLNDLIDDDLWSLLWANEINQIGQIVGVGKYNGRHHGFLLTPNSEFSPVPEPATFLLLGSGLAGLAFYRRKRK